MSKQGFETPECENGCGRRVSASKRFCMTCIERTARNAVKLQEFNREGPMEGTTHIIVKHVNANAAIDQEDLYRANGMLAACRQTDIVRYGTDISTARNHLFLTPELASKFLREVMPEVDLKAQAAGLPIHEVIDTYPSFTERRAVLEEQDVEAKGDGVRIIQPFVKRTM